MVRKNGERLVLELGRREGGWGILLIYECGCGESGEEETENHTLKAAKRQE